MPLSRSRYTLSGNTLLALRAARNALDLLANQLLDEQGQVVVEPLLQHRPQHLLGKFVETLLAARGKGVGEFAKGGRNLSSGRRRDDGLPLRGWWLRGGERRGLWR